MKSLVTNIDLIQKKSFWILFLILFLSNIGHLFLGLEPNGLSMDKPFKIDGDSKDYVYSSERLLVGKEFSFFKISKDTEFPSNISSKKGNEKEILYAFRSPGFAFFYIPLRIIFSQNNALIAFIILQTAFNALAKLVIAILIFRFTRNKTLFILSLIGLTTVSYFSQYNNLLLTDSLGLSFLMFAFYFLIKSLNENFNLKILLFSGFLFALAVFLRPFLIIPFAFAGALLLIYLLTSKIHFKKIFLILVCFGASFIVIDSIWILRNYNLTQKFIPLASTLHFQDHKHSSFKEIKKLAGSLGVSNNWWDVESPVFWFFNKNDKRDIKDVFSDKTLNLEQQQKILNARNSLFTSFNPKENIIQRIKLEKKSESLLKEINFELKEHNFFNSQIKTRFLILTKFLSQPIQRDYHALRYPFNVLIVYGNHFFVNITIWLGFFASVLFLLTKETMTVKYLSICILSVILFFSFVLLSFEYREIHTVLGFLLITTSILINNFKQYNILIRISIISIFILALVHSLFQTTQEMHW